MPEPGAKFQAVLFDLDGVVTKTTRVHAAAWKRLFDDFLARRERATNEELGRFDIELDYLRYVDGKPRYQGVRSFLEARGIELAWGSPSDGPERETICGLGNRKDALFRAELHRGGVEVYPATVAAIHELRQRGIKTALVSSSKNAIAVLESAGLLEAFDALLDGVESERLGLVGKPAPDTFLEAARRLGVPAERAVVVEDAIAGVEAARRGAFGRVVALDRAHQQAALRAAGADVVLGELDLDDLLDLRGLPGRGAAEAAELLPFRGSEGKRQWSLDYSGFVAASQGTREALLTLGNGYFATRGALCEARADGINYPGTYLAGGYSRASTPVDGRVLESEDLVNFPNWLWTSVSAAGVPLDLTRVLVLEHRQSLDLRRGLLLRETRWRDAEGRTTRLSERRLVSMASPHLAALEVTIVAEDWTGELEVVSGIDGRVTNAGVALHHGLPATHLAPVGRGFQAPDTLWLKVETRQSELRVALAARQHFSSSSGGELPLANEESDDRVAHRLRIALHAGEELRLEKVVALYSSRDYAISEPALEACTAVSRVAGFAQMLEAHSLAWAQLWGRFDIQLDERSPDIERPVELLLRLHVFHLVQTLSWHSIDLDVGVPARGWHGEAYQGHVFWDELFVLPFFNLRVPEVSRAVLVYRYRRLDEARARARAADLQGALYPWQSGSNGREETPQLHYNPILREWFDEHTMLQRHVSAAVAYNIWRYYQATLDQEFMAFYGAEVFLEVARMWASSAVFNPERQRYDIRGIMGPDEYHDRYPGASQLGIDNNAYTNVMASWVLWRARAVLDSLPAERRRELCDRLGVHGGELERWDAISRRLRISFLPDGIISEFEGFERLPELDLVAYAREHGDMQHINQQLESQGKSPNDYRITKQADVLMLFYVFSAAELREIFSRLEYSFNEHDIVRNVDYYLARTTHGSTLSRVAHSWVLARIDRERSWHLFVEALKSDIADIQGGTTREGIHLGAMAGSIDLVQRCYTGLEVRDGVLWLKPRLPNELQFAQMYLHYRGQSFTLQLAPKRVVVRAVESSAGPFKFGVHNLVHEIWPGQSAEFTL